MAEEYKFWTILDTDGVLSEPHAERYPDVAAAGRKASSFAILHPGHQFVVMVSTDAHCTMPPHVEVETLWSAPLASDGHIETPPSDPAPSVTVHPDMMIF